MTHPQLTDLTSIAAKAGEILRAGYGADHQTRHKGPIDLVTEVDQRSEALIIDTIRQKFPDHRIIAEESGAHSGADDHCWYIDPLDGTMNFAHGLPIFSVSIAYAYKGQVQMGVVYDPMRDHLFQAERGQGAALGEKPLRVSGAAELIDSLLVTGFPYDAHHNHINNLENFVYFTTRSQGVRRLGSAAIDLCYIAAGWLDGYWEIRLNAWDVAAGGLICAEAGGLVSDLDGAPDYLRPPYAIIAANPRLHGKILAGLRRESN